MILHLAASTTAAGYAIFDPAAIPTFVGADVEEAFETILAQKDLGNLILYSDSFDGRTLLRVCVDEDPGDELTLRASHFVRGGFCRFPSGRICFTGVEDVQRFQRQPAGDARAELPPGTYGAEGFDVDWEPGHLRRALHDCVGRGPYTLRGILYVLTSGGCLGTILSVCFLALAALVGYWQVAIIVAAAFIALTGASILLRKLPIMRRVDAAERELQMRYPPVVLALQRLPADADITRLQGLAFGRGHVRRQRTGGFEVVFPQQDAT